MSYREKVQAALARTKTEKLVPISELECDVRVARGNPDILIEIFEGQDEKSKFELMCSVCYECCKDNGEPIFEEARLDEQGNVTEEGELERLGLGVVSPLFEAAIELNGIIDEKISDKAKNSDTPADAS